MRMPAVHQMIIEELNARAYRLEIAAAYASARATLASARYHQALYGYTTGGALTLVKGDRRYIAAVRKFQAALPVYVTCDARAEAAE